MDKKPILLACLLSFSFICTPVTFARAVNGPGDALALFTTATFAATAGFSAYSWYKAEDPNFVLNQLAAIQGNDKWAAWILDNAKYLTVASGTISALMLSQFCTHTGIASIDRRLGLPRSATPYSP